MGVKTGAAAAVVAGVVGGGLRVLLFPQFVVGALLISAGVVVKLSRNAAGVALLLLAVVVVAFFSIVFNERIVDAAEKVAPRVWKRMEGLREDLRESFGNKVKETPPWVFTLVAFSLPAVAQFLGSLGTVRMLASIDNKSLPGTEFIAVFSLLYLGTLTLGVSRAWLKPSKVSFLLQSFWVLRALFSSSGDDLKFRKFLPSVLTGWGGFFLSLTPGSAVVSALKAAAASAAIAGAGVATVEGVRNLAAKNPQEEEDDDDDDDNDNDGREPRDEGKTKEVSSWVPSTKDIAETWRSWFDEDNFKRFFEENFSREALQITVANIATKMSSFSLLPSSTALKATDGDGEVVDDDGKPIEEAAEEIKKDLNFNVAELAPPMSAAAAVTLFRALPTVLTLGVGILLSLGSLLSGKFKPATVSIPVLLAPFAMGEIIALVNQVGLRNILHGGKRLEDKYHDGMSLLLWQSPTMLRAWENIADFNDRVQNENLMEGIKQMPQQFLNPDENTIQETPTFGWIIAGKLLVSIILDIIGASSYAIPALGELTDFAWAPLQGYLVHYMYGVSWISWLSVVEEILPFTDILPSATIGWFITYGQYFPVWAIRFARSVAIMPRNTANYFTKARSKLKSKKVPKEEESDDELENEHLKAH